MSKQTEFIEKIAPILQKYAPKYNIKVVSPIIGQACIESAWGKSKLSEKYFNFFGIKCGSKWKGPSVNMKTQEEYTVGTKVTINDNFRVYSNLEEGMKGYFEFIQLERYHNLRGITSPQKYLETIKADGYATSSTYVNTVMAVVNQYNLTKYDGSNSSTEVDKKSKTIKASKPATMIDKSVSGTYKVTADALNVRDGAGTNNKVLTVVRKGKKVKCYGYLSNDTYGSSWLYVMFTQSNIEYIGFVSKKFLKKI